MLSLIYQASIVVGLLTVLATWSMFSKKKWDPQGQVCHAKFTLSVVWDDLCELASTVM